MSRYRRGELHSPSHGQGTFPYSQSHGIPKWIEFIDKSFLNDEFKERYKSIISERISRII